MKSSNRRVSNGSPAQSFDHFDAITEVRDAPAAARSPRSVAWVLLSASAAAVLASGLIVTALVFYQLTPAATVPSRPGFWMWLMAGAVLTIVSLSLRSLRWVFLMRRANARIPIRDAYIGYLAGFSLLLAPFLLGEIAMRAYVLRDRGGVPVATTAVLNIWERLLDAVALAAIAGFIGVLTGQAIVLGVSLLGCAVATTVPAMRRLCLRIVIALLQRAPKTFELGERTDFRRLAEWQTWHAAFAASVGAWLLPGLAFWGLASGWGFPYGLGRAELAYATSTLAGAVVFAPGGIVVAGGGLLADLGRAGFPETVAALAGVGIRLATAGVSTAIGGAVLLLHLRTRPTAGSQQFEQLADAYDAQIPEARRLALLTRKTELMRAILSASGIGRRGLDAGCGQGWHVARMRELGFDVTGIDSSAGQVQRAARHVGAPGLITVGSVLQIPAPDATYDFAYTVNVLHHLPSIDAQRQAFTELIRVVRPGGLLFVHEINTRNALFRFYMGYVFPSVNCLDEGVERWLLPHQLAQYTDVPVTEIRYFTFLPDFAPAAIVRLLAPLERRLEASRFGPCAAHYMAALQKPS